MKLHRWSDIPVETLSPTIERQVLHTDQMTVARLRMRRGAIVPRHQHINEQVTTVAIGKLRFIFDDGEQIVGAGESLQIPSNVAHSAEALEDSEALDLFVPLREDWIRGEDAYLRGQR